MAVVALLAAGGSGKRFDSVAVDSAAADSVATGATNGKAKQFLLLAGKPMLWHAARPFVESSRVDSVVVVVRSDEESQAKTALADFGNKCQVLPVGGETRAVSVCNGLADFDAEDWAVVHDAARPCLPPEALARLLDLDDNENEGAALALPLVDALKKAEDGAVCGVVEKKGHWLMQTPQRFRAGALRVALAKFPDAADEAEAMWRCGVRARLVAGDVRNIKITHPADMSLAEALLQS